MIDLRYHHNNSGGSWWLTDKNWEDLEKAGWTVEWRKYEDDDCFVHKGRFLGALATEASKRFENPDDGVAEWAKVVGLDPWDQGCGCCGPPHNFSFDRKGKSVRPVMSSPKPEGWK